MKNSDRPLQVVFSLRQVHCGLEGCEPPTRPLNLQPLRMHFTDVAFESGASGLEVSGVRVGSL